jgi:hypothetical protein
MNTIWKDLMTSLLEGQILKDWLHLEKFFEEVMIKPTKIDGIFSTTGVVMLMVDVPDGYVIVGVPPKGNVPTDEWQENLLAFANIIVHDNGCIIFLWCGPRF